MATVEDFLKMPFLYHIPGMEHVNVQKNLVYQTVNDQKYHFDVYSPSDGSTRKFPAVVLVHGEAPMNNLKDTGFYTSLGSLLAAKDMVAVTFDHRTILAGANISDVCEDIKQLINSILNNSDELNIDANSIAVWSFSAGVPFGLKVCFELNRTNIKSLVAYYGPADFNTLGKMLNINITANNKEKSALEIIDDCTGDMMPLFIARAGLDSWPIINDSIDQLISKTLNHNLDVTICNHATGQHAFDMLDDTARTKEIIEMTLSFLVKSLS